MSNYGRELTGIIPQKQETKEDGDKNKNEEDSSKNENTPTKEDSSLNSDDVNKINGY